MTVRPQQSAKNKNIYICVFIYICRHLGGLNIMQKYYK